MPMMKKATEPSHGVVASGASHRIRAPRYMKLEKMR